MTKTTNTIEFATATTDAATGRSPWEVGKKTSYNDMILKPEFTDRKLKFPIGTTWMRIVPAFRESAHGWMMGVHAMEFDGGRCVHPRTHGNGNRSAFDIAYAWLLQNCPEKLRSKTNRDGFRLLPDPMALFWVLLEEKGKMVSRLVQASAYDGSRGGIAGLGAQIWNLTRDTDETGALAHDVVNPQEGRLVSLEKTQAKGARYPSYTLRVGRQPAPIAELIAKTDPEELAAMCPLENVVRELTAEEEWECVGKIIPADLVARIRASMG
jgi:hypothetical protein